MKNRLLFAAACTVLGLSLTACQSSKTEVTDPAAGTTTAEAVTTEPSAAETADTTAADDKKLSGEVTVYMPSPSGLNEKYISDFQNKTGLKVNLFEGTTGEILARLEAEKENPIADVVVLASWADGLSLKGTDVLMSYPEAKNADKLTDGWVNQDNTLFGTSASALGVIYNTTELPTLDADWSELADAKYKDMVTIPDPEKSGSCKDFLAGYMYANQENGWKTWEDLAAEGMTVSGANKAALEAVTTGEKAILVAGVDYNAYASIEKGEPLAIYYPKSGTVINPRPAMILKSSKNIDNAKAFIDYLLSDDAQSLVANAYLLPGRTDIKCDNRTNISDIPVINLDWEWMMEHSNEYAQKLNEICK